MFSSPETGRSECFFANLLFFYVLKKINVILMQKNGSETFAFLHTLSKFHCGYRTAQVISFTGDTSTENRRDLLKFLEKQIFVL